MEQYYSIQDKKTFMVMPVVYFENNKNWYAEGRYNYEAQQTLSIYAGKTFRKDSQLSFEISPMAGVVAGQFNGGSAGVNVELDYAGFSLSSQSQYTFSITDKTQNFTYSWTDISRKIFLNIYAGLSAQHTKVYKEDKAFEAGVFLGAEFKNWAVPLYIFNPANANRYFILGLQCQWQYKKNKTKN
jgi:hypothetical protein